MERVVRLPLLTVVPWFKTHLLLLSVHEVDGVLATGELTALRYSIVPLGSWRYFWNFGLCSLILRYFSLSG
ncbi:hypothetical protein BXZ70DRAFT_397036 [Cristinia sonorae]|uniref:Uncharacterized protein n=1 Tax=Cristinia sonorae TaxID=1940300 RepID=A0A8K0UVR6_9AGAR|nr:hypothetical protein BXZ70DRAFT_397036 [Cristinia sonorae]